jgi:hypothetical protein
MLLDAASRVASLVKPAAQSAAAAGSRYAQLEAKLRAAAAC